MSSVIKYNQHQAKRSLFGRMMGAIAQNSFAVMALLGMFGLGIYGAYMQVSGSSFNINGFSFGKGSELAMSAEMEDALTKRHINRKFEMYGVFLGMTQAMTQGVHPSAKVTVDRTGEPVMIIPTSKGTMVAWMFSNNDFITVGGKRIQDNKKRVYRLRLDEALPELSENDILSRYGMKYGRPIETNCTRSGQSGTSSCAYRWWGGDGIELQAIAKKKRDLRGRLYTQLTTIATSTIKSPKVNYVSLSSFSMPKRRKVTN